MPPAVHGIVVSSQQAQAAQYLLQPQHAIGQDGQDGANLSAAVARRAAAAGAVVTQAANLEAAAMDVEDHVAGAAEERDPSHTVWLPPGHEICFGMRPGVKGMRVGDESSSYDDKDVVIELLAPPPGWGPPQEGRTGAPPTHRPDLGPSGADGGPHSAEIAGYALTIGKPHSLNFSERTRQQFERVTGERFHRCAVVSYSGALLRVSGVTPLVDYYVSRKPSAYLCSTARLGAMLEMHRYMASYVGQTNANVMGGQGGRAGVAVGGTSFGTVVRDGGQVTYVPIPEVDMLNRSQPTLETAGDAMYNVMRHQWRMCLAQCGGGPVALPVQGTAEQVAREAVLLGRGPRVLVCGPYDTGKSTLCTTLLNYAIRLGHAPAYLEVDPEVPSMGVPGCFSVACTKKGRMVDPHRPTFDKISHFLFGRPGLEDATSQTVLRRFQWLLEVMSNCVPEDASRSAGVIINTCGFVEGHGFEFVQHMLEPLKVDYVICVGDESMEMHLVAASEWMAKVCSVPRPMGIRRRSDAFRAELQAYQYKKYFDIDRYIDLQWTINFKAAETWFYRYLMEDDKGDTWGQLEPSRVRKMMAELDAGAVIAILDDTDTQDEHDGRVLERPIRGLMVLEDKPSLPSSDGGGMSWTGGTVKLRVRVRQDQCRVAVGSDAAGSTRMIRKGSKTSYLVESRHFLLSEFTMEL